MLLTKIVEIELCSANIEHYKYLNYYIPTYKIGRKERVKRGTKILVKVNDLPEGSHTEVELLCDYCKQTIIKRAYKDYLYLKSKQIEKDCCEKCKNIKAQEVFIEKYGTANIMKIEGVKDKIIQYNIINYGVKWCMQRDDVKKKMSETYILRHRDKLSKSFSGENNPNWKGGITPENERIRHSIEMSDWRKQVFERDNYACQCCGDNKGGNLRAHHILNFFEYPELRFDINNGITLCSNCHDFHKYGSFHHVYGTYNNNLEQLNEYIFNINNKSIMKD